jgi:hypothetical protein
MNTTKMNIHSPNTEVSLRQGQLWHDEGDLRGEVIYCLKGMLWITQENGSRDVILQPNETFWITCPGKVVVQSVGRSSSAQDAMFRYSRIAMPGHINAYAPEVHGAA